MFRSVFLRKMVFLVLVALCASALLSATLFRYAANAVTKQNEETLLIDKAHALSEFLNTHLQQEETTNFADKARSLSGFLSEYIRTSRTEDSNDLMILLQATDSYTDHNVLGAYFSLYTDTGIRVKTSQVATQQDSNTLATIDFYARTHMLTNNEYSNLIGRVPLEDTKASVVVVQVPIVLDDAIFAYLVIGDEYSMRPRRV